MKKRIAILGSTGSIGTQSLEVIEQNPENFEVEVITANNNVDLLIQQAKKFQPNTVVIANHDKYKMVSEALAERTHKSIMPEKKHLTRWYKWKPLILF